MKLSYSSIIPRIDRLSCDELYFTVLRMMYGYTTKLNGSHIYALSLLKYILEIYLVFVNEKLSHGYDTTTGGLFRVRNRHHSKI